ncbi:MAG: glycosyl hydrolase [Asgard group archaeon]|nr:glycosyl hydrolase [Asgard group archaeon]
MSEKKELLEKYPYYDESLSVDLRVMLILNRLTLKEKFKLLSGKNFSWWTTKPIRHLNIKRMGMTDGPHGISFHSSFKKNTKFPCAKCLSATWNPTLAREYGVALAEEVRAVGRHILLAPGINIDRTPVNGRTFEYYSEDPYLTKEIAIPLVKGVQSKRVGACIKHYALNNQETNRRSVSVEIGERSLRELYLQAFEEVVKKADPWVVMGSYNKINGVHACENKELLRDILMDEWGFNGFIVTDWWATRKFKNPEKAIKAGLSLEMPQPSVYKIHRLRKAFRKKKFNLKDLDFVVERLLKVMIQVGLFDFEKVPEGKRNTDEHKKIARQIAEEGIILLKNQKNILPLNREKIKTIAIVGPNAQKKFGKIHYGGSAAVVAPYEITAYEGIKAKCGKTIKVTDNPAKADICLFIGGLNHSRGQDCENFDRPDLKLPDEQITQLLATIEQNKKTIVILINGSPITMSDWHSKVPAIIEAWYPGQEGGYAIADVLFGDVNPSGKLPITFPKKLSDSPAHKSERTYPGDEQVFYDEGIFVGYRHFDKEKIKPLYPFGFGLSYTQFALSNAKLSTYDLTDDELMKITLDIENVGKKAGSEVIQLYIGANDSKVPKPIKELIGFTKVTLEPGEKKQIEFTINEEVLNYYDGNADTWITEDGKYTLYAGNSSRDIYFTQEFNYKSSDT